MIAARFSAWNIGSEVDLDDYCNFIKQNSDSVDAYIALDVIPGSPGVLPTLEQREASASEGWDNLLYMEGTGLSPVPVFHQGEDPKWLRRMIEHGCSYVGISPANDRTTDQKIAWLDRVFESICDDRGMPCVKTHSFGATSIPVAIRYPWFSVDSTTWLATGSRFGMVMVPKPSRNGDGGWRYDERISRVFVSKESKAIVRPGNIDMLAPAERGEVARFVLEAGYTLHDLAESRRARNVTNAHFYKVLSQSHRRKPFVPGRRTQLFPDFDFKLEGVKYVDELEPLKVVFATNTTRQANEVLNAIGAEDRLLSYFYLRTLPPTWLATYVANGIGPKQKRMRRRL